MSFKPFRTSVHVRTPLYALRGSATDDRSISHSVLSDAFSERELKDLRGSFPLDHPTELDDHDFLDDSGLEDVEDGVKLVVKISETASDDRRSSLKSPVFDSGFTPPFLPQISRLGSMGGISSISPTRSMDPGTHLGKVVVLRDISFVT